jgi:hypothetical protein
MISTTQPWIGNRWTDILFILMPPFFCLLFIILFPTIFQNQDGMSDAWWVALILLIDVAHVYSTLYRTYFDPVAYKIHKNKLLAIPFVAFVAGVLLYSYHPLLFWRLLAYTAVFHFVRQQYGFMRIYSRRENSSWFFSIINTITIYTATIYPLLFWHLSADRKFNWFVEGDFLQLNASANVLAVCTILYYLVLIIYCIKEIIFSIQNKTINLPRNAVIAGTTASWYIGIVYFNGDMAFTLLNVVSHGIPYMALIWIYGKKSASVTEVQPSRLLQWVFSRYGLLLFLAIIFLLAFLEEGLWDITLWKEHTTVFGIFNWGNIKLSEALLTLVVPLLALPQITHYIIDGFIWKVKKEVDV